MMLNLGCGNNKINGFINIDMNESCNPDIIASVENLDRYFVDGSIEEIVAFDLIEHFDKSKIKDILHNWFAKLIKGGVMVIRTVDIDRLIKLYLRNGRRLGICGLYGKRLDFSVEKFVWHLFSETDIPGMAHKWIYSKSSIDDLLCQIGFSKITFTKEKNLERGTYKYAGINSDVGQPDFTNLHLIAIK
jgi:hypothetical protein